jgi:peptidyl-prolyl cis-trans isomerase B (cyclophilin B)
VTSNRDRARATARARLEREMALRAERATKRRRTQTIVASVAAGAVLVGAIVWVAIATADSDEKAGASPSGGPSASSAPTTCTYRGVNDPDPSASAPTSPAPLPSGAREVGKPSADVPRTGKEIMTLTTNQGVIKIEMDLTKVPCTAGSFAYLAQKKFFDNTKCHRLVPAIGALQCGDPQGDGTGGPTYRFDDENLPLNRRPAYSEGLVAMANAGANTNGSQFFFVYKDNALQPQYTVIGKVTQGLDVVKKIAEGGDDGKYEPEPGGGMPKLETIIQTVTVEKV